MDDSMRHAERIHDSVKQMASEGNSQTLEERVAALEKVVAYLYVRTNPWKHDD